VDEVPNLDALDLADLERYAAYSLCFDASRPIWDAVRKYAVLSLCARSARLAGRVRDAQDFEARCTSLYRERLQGNVNW
jgi:hypothetical protein